MQKDEIKMTVIIFIFILSFGIATLAYNYFQKTMHPEVCQRVVAEICEREGRECSLDAVVEVCAE